MSIPPQPFTRRARRRQFRLRPLGVGELLDESLALYRANSKLFLSLIAVPSVVFALVFTAVNSISMSAISWNTATPTSGFRSFGEMGVIWLCATPIVFLCWAYQQAALTTAISSCYVDRDVTAKDVRQSVKGFTVRAVWSYLIVGLIVTGISGVVLVAPMVVGFSGGPESPLIILASMAMCCAWPIPLLFVILFEFVAVALVSENLSATAAIGRSVKVATRDFWRVVGVTLLVGLVSLVLSLVIMVAVSLPFSVLGLDDTVSLGSIKTTPVTIVTRAIITLIQSAGYALLVPFIVGVTVLLYFDIRIRKEGFDVEMLARAMPAPGGPTRVL